MLGLVMQCCGVGDPACNPHTGTSMAISPWPSVCYQRQFGPTPPVGSYSMQWPQLELRLRKQYDIDMSTQQIPGTDPGRNAHCCNAWPKQGLCHNYVTRTQAVLCTLRRSQRGSKLALAYACTYVRDGRSGRGEPSAVLLEHPVYAASAVQVATSRHAHLFRIHAAGHHRAPWQCCGVPARHMSDYCVCGNLLVYTTAL